MRTAKPASPSKEPTGDGPRGMSERTILILAAICLAGYLVAYSLTRGLVFASLLLTPEDWIGVWFSGDGRQPWGLFDRAGVALLAALVLAAAFGCGWWIVQRLGLDREMTIEERIGLALAAGLQLTSLATLAAGLTGVLTVIGVGVAIVVALALWGAGGWGLERISPLDAAEPEPADLPQLPWVEAAVLLAAVPCALLLLLGAMLPPVDFDVREYHLQVPKEWLAAGRIDFLPHNVYGNMPLGAEMQALLAMLLAVGERGWWWGALAGKLVNAVWPLVTALILFAAGRRCGSALAGAVAATLYLTLPWISHVAMAGLNDATLAGYGWVALYAVLRGIGLLRSGETDADLEPVATHSALRWLVLAGWLAGGAASVKYTGLAFVLPPLALLALWNGGRWNWQLPLVLLVATGLSCGLWYGKNAALTGNPVYPLAGTLLDGATRTPERIAQWDRVHSPQPDADGNRFSLRQLMEHLGRLVVGGLYLSPVLCPLAVLGGFVGRPRDLRWILVALILLLLALWWLFTHRLERFWLPGWPLVAMLAGLGAAAGTTTLWRNTMLAAVAIAALVGTLLVGSPYIGDNRFFVSLEALRLDVPKPDEYGRVNPAHHWLNEHARRGTLSVGDAAVFDLERPVIYGTCFDACPFEQLTAADVAALSAGDKQAAERLRARLDSLGIDYVYVHWAEIARYRSPGNYGFTDYVQPEVFELLVKHQVLAPPVSDLLEGYGQIYPVLKPAARP